MRQIVKKTGNRYQFTVWWDRFPNAALYLDFGPLLKDIRPPAPCVFLHWQPMPRIYRRFGVYDSATDSYYGVDYDKLIIETAQSRVWQLPDVLFPNIRPTAVIIYDKSVLIANDSPRLIIRPLGDS